MTRPHAKFKNINLRGFLQLIFVIIFNAFHECVGIGREIVNLEKTFYKASG
jgi:hypothetical protein